MANPETTEKPAHPLVIDKATGLCRYATQDDIHRMESICKAFDQLSSDVWVIAKRSEHLKMKFANHG